MIPFILAVGEAIASKPTHNTNCGENWGLFVEGKAAQQGITLGGGTQSLRTPFSLKTNLQSKFWWKK